MTKLTPLEVAEALANWRIGGISGEAADQAAQIIREQQAEIDELKAALFDTREGLSKWKGGRAMKPETAWAAIALHGNPRPFIHAGLVRTYRREVQEDMGRVYAREGETIEQGWKRAYRRGWRAVRVTVEMKNEP